jgi:hypothetical protein
MNVIAGVMWSETQWRRSATSLVFLFCFDFRHLRHWLAEAEFKEFVPVD